MFGKINIYFTNYLLYQSLLLQVFRNAMAFAEPHYLYSRRSMCRVERWHTKKSKKEIVILSFESFWCLPQAQWIGNCGPWLHHLFTSSSFFSALSLSNAISGPPSTTRRSRSSALVHDWRSSRWLGIFSLFLGAHKKIKKALTKKS